MPRGGASSKSRGVRKGAGKPPPGGELNQRIADRLRQMADLLEQQAEDGFRIAAYRRAAKTLDALDRPVDALLAEEGRAGLIALPGIGAGIAGAIAEMLATGRWAQFERLEGSLDPERLFQSVPGIGPKLADQLHEELGVDTLEQLEVAAHDGRLEQLKGVGPRKTEAIIAALNSRLGRLRIRPRGETAEPPVSVLLAVDESYRRKATEGSLRRIAPKRFNPTGEAWLPVLHEDRGNWRFTALFSNTARAHELGRTKDWVVLYFHAGATPERQRTVVTETQGSLKGRRVVRGREAECVEFYARAKHSA